MTMVDVVFLAAYRPANGSSLWAWFKGRQPSGAVLHSLHEPDVRRPSSDSVDMLQCLMYCHISVIVIFSCQYPCSFWATCVLVCAQVMVSWRYVIKSGTTWKTIILRCSLGQLTAVSVTFGLVSFWVGNFLFLAYHKTFIKNTPGIY